MALQIDISVVIPAYNEEARILATLNALRDVVLSARNALGEVEVIVVCDGCTDRTEDVVRGFGWDDVVRVVSYPGNRGKGHAVRLGIHASRGRYVLFMDADGSTPVREMTRLLEPLQHGDADIVIGSRRATGANLPVRQPPVRRFLGACFATVVRWLVGLPVLDTQCGFKLFRGDVARDLFARMTCDGFAFDLELLALARARNLRVREMGVEWHDVAGSTVRPWRDGLRMLRAALDLRLHPPVESCRPASHTAVVEAETGADLNWPADLVRFAGAVLLAALLFRLLLLPLLPLCDPSEGRYATIATHMSQSGDWVTPRVQINGELVPFLGKPPLYFWLSAACVRLLGVNELAVRLPSLVCAAGLVLLVWFVTARYIGRRAAVIACLSLATSGLFFALSGAVLVDMVLAFCVGGALLCYFAFSFEPQPGTRRRWSLGVFSFLALGFLTKGPVAVLLFGLPVFVWTARHRRWSDLRGHAWLPGIALFVAIVAPWFVLAERHNPGFLHYFFVNENLLRYLKHDYGDLYGHGHQYPRGAALLMMFVAGLPWMPYALWRACRRGTSVPRERSDSTQSAVASYFLLGFVCQALFWCLARQLLLTYMLPALPSFAVWFAVVVQRGPKREREHRALLRTAAGLVAVYAIVGIAIVPILSAQRSTCLISRAALDVTRSADSRIVFVHKTPYSASFYCGDRLEPHPKEDALASVERGRTMGRETLLVVKERYRRRLPDHVLAGMTALTRIGPWTLLQVGENGSDIDLVEGVFYDTTRPRLAAVSLEANP